MDVSERDSTQDWLLPEHAAPAAARASWSVRIDEALATARASEAAVMTVGAAALDAAEQARRAAELAERASIAALGAQERVASAHGFVRGPRTRACVASASGQTGWWRGCESWSALPLGCRQPATPQTRRDPCADPAAVGELHPVDRPDRLDAPHRAG